MICDLKKCTGCYACFNICPKNCIKMIEDDFGFLYPKIDYQKCIKCNLCRHICPSLNHVELKMPLTSYASWALDKYEHKSSTSGGVASVLSRYIIRNGGVVFGAAVDNDLNISHIRIDKEADLARLKGSKYVQSMIKDTYNQCLKDLKDKKLVLFTGTPCQIAGLKKFLRREYENLYTIDIICHGVPSKKYLNDYISSKCKNIPYDNISFRDECGFNFRLINNEEVVFLEPMNDSLYYIGFMQSLFYRESCYTCDYAQHKRCSDITIGDFWGLGSKVKFEHSKKNGISVILPITEKGMNILNKCKENLFMEERKINEAVEGNTQLRVPSMKFKNYYKFKDEYIKYGFMKASKRSLQEYIVLRNIKIMIKRTYIYKILKNKGNMK